MHIDVVGYRYIFINKNNLYIYTLQKGYQVTEIVVKIYGKRKSSTLPYIFLILCSAPSDFNSNLYIYIIK